MNTKNKKSFPVSHWDWIFRIVAGVGIVFLSSRQIWYLLFGRFNIDEFENLQIIWLALNGWFPGQDYLHTHLPIYNIAIYPIYLIFGPSIHLPGFVRLLLFPFTVLLMYQIIWLARQASGSYKAAAAAVIFLFSSPLLANCIAEARPDTIGLPLALGALILSVGKLKTFSVSNWRYYGSALLVGAALLFTHKIVFVIPILAWIFERRFLVTEPALPIIKRLCRLISWTAIAAFPTLLVVVFMLIKFNLDQANLLMLFGAGLYATIPKSAEMIRQLLLSAVFSHTFLTLFLALWGIFKVKWRQWSQSSSSFLNRFLAILFIVHLAQISFQKTLLTQVVVLPLIFASILAAVVVSKLSTRSTSIILLATILIPVLWPTSGFSPYCTRTEQLAGFEYIQKHVPPDQSVLDTYTGYGTFRPQVASLNTLYMRLFWSGTEGEFSPNAIMDELRAGKVGAVCLDPPDPHFHYKLIHEALAEKYRESTRFKGLYLLDQLTSEQSEK